MQLAADDQGHRDGIGIHDQHMLEPKREQLWQRQYLVNGGERLGSSESSQAANRTGDS